MLRRALAAVLFAGGAAAWPFFLKCSIDADTRLVPGAVMMGGIVGACADPCPVSIAVSAAAADGTSTINVTTTGTMDFAVRLSDGSGTLSSADGNLAGQCDSQMVTDPGGKQYPAPAAMAPTKAGSYLLQFTPAAGKTIDEAVITVGYAAGPSLPGYGEDGATGVYVLTYPAGAGPKPPPPPAPKPAGTPIMRLLDDQTCGGEKVVKKLDEAGKFTLAITVAGDAGFAYNCSTAYDPAVGVAEGDCIDWLPQSVLDAKESLAVTLSGTDSAGKLGVCMNWELAYAAGGSGKPAWRPGTTSPATVAGLKGMLQSGAYRARVAERLAPALAALPRTAAKNNTPASRVEAFAYYLDSMTHVSHRCVPKGEPAYGFNIPKIPFFPDVPGLGFPPVAHTETQMRVSHALLAATGTLWSIDRKCHDAWYIKQGKGVLGWDESCVPTVPGFPHCHESCSMTWRLAPGGAASWGIYALSHHVPSPAIAIITHGDMDEAAYGDLGCGGAARRG